MDTGDALRVLGLIPGYGEDELLRAYRRRAIFTHPDQGGSTAAFLDTLQARDTLMRQLHRPRSGVVIIDDARPWKSLFSIVQRRIRKPTRNLL